MGLASSQARLLSLTARQHDVEYRAQALQAQKLRLANNSDAAYENYTKQLNATKFKTKIYGEDGKSGWVDANVVNLLRLNSYPSAQNDTIFLKNIEDGEIYLPKTLFESYNAALGNKINFAKSQGATTLKWDTELAEAKTNLDKDIELGYDFNPIKGNYLTEDDDIKYQKYLTAKTYQDDALAVSTILAKNIKNGTGDGKIYGSSMTNAEAEKIQAFIDRLKDSPYSNRYLDVILSYKGDSECRNSSNNKAIIQYENYGKKYINTEDLEDVEGFVQDGYIAPNKKIEFDKAEQMQIYLNGGKCSFKQESGMTIRQDVYDDKLKAAIDSYTDGQNKNIGMILHSVAANIVSDAVILLTIKENGNTYYDLKQKYDTYAKDKDIYDNILENPYFDDEVLGAYYVNLYEGIQQAEGIKVLTSNMAKDSELLTNLLRSNIAILSIYNPQQNEYEDYSAASQKNMKEVTNDNLITLADSEYDTALDAINNKERKISAQLSKLEMERTSIKMEIDSLKTIKEDNIQTAFKVFG